MRLDLRYRQGAMGIALACLVVPGAAAQDRPPPQSPSAPQSRAELQAQSQAHLQSQAQLQAPPAPDFSSIPDEAALARARQTMPAQQSVPAGTGLPPPPLRLRIAPGLAEAAPELAAALRQRPDLMIAEQADYALDTLAEFPQTLMITEWWGGAPDDVALMAPNQREELGNLQLDDYHARLDAALRQRQWVLRLLALNAARAPAQGEALGTTTCMSFHPATDDTIECDLGGTMATLNGLPNRRTARPAGFAVRNDGPAPRYLYLIDIGPGHEVAMIPLGDGGLVAPGQWAVGTNEAIQANGPHRLITLAAAQPLAAALLDGKSLASATPAECTAPLAAWLCTGSGPGSPDASWAASASRYDLNTPHIAGIGGGYTVPPKQAPWMAQIYSTVPYTEADFLADDKKPVAERAYLRARQGPGLAHRCGGTLIDFDLVLTAAHCVAKGGFAGAGAARVFAQRRVRMGTLDLGRQGVTYAIDGMVVHGGYDPNGHRRDIALLHLKADRGTAASRMMREPIAMEPGRKPKNQAWLPAELPGFRLDPRAPVKAYGWGFTETLAAGAANVFFSDGKLRQNPEELQYGDLQTLDWASCLKRMGAPFDKKMLCVITGAESARRRPGVTVFSCVGDSGGPLIRKIAQREVLVGVTAWSRGCGNPNSASVYTDVAAYKNWITAAVAQIRPGQVLAIDDNLIVRRVAGAGASRP